MDLQGGIKLGPSLWKLVELNWTVTQFMQSLDGTWTELQFQVSQELDLWTKFWHSPVVYKVNYILEYLWCPIPIWAVLRVLT